MLTVVNTDALLTSKVVAPTVAIAATVRKLRDVDPRLPIVPVALNVVAIVFFIRHFNARDVNGSFKMFVLV